MEERAPEAEEEVLTRGVKSSATLSASFALACGLLSCNTTMATKDCIRQYEVNPEQSNSRLRNTGYARRERKNAGT